MSKNLEGATPNESVNEHDCDCGCHGAGDCGGTSGHAEIVEQPNRSRRRLMLGGATIAVVATLANRRAFACQCGPISRAGSLNPSHSSTNHECGGLTPGYWANHALATTYALGGVSPSSRKLGSVLNALNTVDPTSANMTFKTALCTPPSNAFHWAGAILNALTPAWNPSYGYSISTMNSALLTAYNNGHGASATTILNQLEQLENDYNLGTVQSPYNTNQPVC